MLRASSRLGVRRGPNFWLGLPGTSLSSGLASSAPLRAVLKKRLGASNEVMEAGSIRCSGQSGHDGMRTLDASSATVRQGLGRRTEGAHKARQRTERPRLVASHARTQADRPHIVPAAQDTSPTGMTSRISGGSACRAILVDRKQDFQRSPIGDPESGQTERARARWPSEASCADGNWMCEVGWPVAWISAVLLSV